MNRNAARFVQYAAGLLGLVTLGWVLTGQASKPAAHGYPTDWTHHQVIYSQPATAERARLLENDPRYMQQWYRRNVARFLPTEGTADAVLRFSDAQTNQKSRIHKDWSENMGTGATVGAGNFPAKWAFNATVANCSDVASPDYVVFSTGLQSSSTVASIVAFDNLYSGCSGFGAVPTTYWAYDTTTLTSAPGTIKTSPIMSLDGSQIAFVQTDSVGPLGHGTVVLLKWKAGDGSLAAPANPHPGTPATYATCATPPCMTSFDLHTRLGVQTGDTTSSVYYDYTGDIAWVGDSQGLLHQFHPFFNGTPAEVTTSTWPLQVNLTNPTALSSPVFDRVSGNVFVGDAGGFIESVNASTGVPIVSAQVDHGTGIVSGPVIDIGNELLYVFASSDGGTTCAGGPCAAVYQFPATFGLGATGTKVTVGTAGLTPNPLYFGAFDSGYLNSHTATGNIWVCGNTGGSPTLYRIPVAGPTLPAAGTASATLSTASAGCSPVTDVANPSFTVGSREFLFVSPQNNGRMPACGGGGCLISIASAWWQHSTAYAVGQEARDSNGRVEVASTNGTSGSTPPVWPTVAGNTVSDGTVIWVNGGFPNLTGLSSWAANHTYAAANRIVDTNGNTEVVTVSGTSDPVNQPTWPAAAGAITTDGSVTWINAGLVPISAVQANGGTSGIIMDNTASTPGGASQVYFSILGSQACPTSGGTGGCAIQTSQ